MQISRIKGWFLVSIGMLMLVAGCGSSGSGSSTSAQTTTVSGSVYAAPVSRAVVVVLNSAGTTTIAGPVTTNVDGTYSIGIPSSAMTGTILFRSSGGTFIDEATGATTTAGSLAAYMPAGSMGSDASVNLDPSSTVMAGLVSGGKTSSEAAAAFASAFGYTPDASIAPRNEPYSASSTTAQRLAGLRAMAFSRLTMDLGLSPDKQFDLLEALSDDLADGSLDGMNGASPVWLGTGSIPEDIMNKFEHALVTCLSDTLRNMTGLTVDQVGNLSFSKVALTQNYRVEYVPAGATSPKMGKTMFQVRITNRSDGSPATGLTVALMPMMHMSTKNHATPVDAVSESVTPGTYDCTAYYLMESGLTMGLWELKVVIGMGMGAETATFYPPVKKDTTALFKLYGNQDLIKSTSTSTLPEKRVYLLFNDGLITGSTSTFNLFVATKETMMYFPAVSIGSVLSNTTATWTVDGSPNTSLEASLDNTFPAPGTVTGFDNGGGHWSLPGINGLSTGVTTTMYVRFTVNSEIKTAGTTTSAAAYATFKVTP